MEGPPEPRQRDAIPQLHDSSLKDLMEGPPYPRPQDARLQLHDSTLKYLMEGTSYQRPRDARLQMHSLLNIQHSFLLLHQIPFFVLV